MLQMLLKIAFNGLHGFVVLLSYLLHGECHYRICQMLSVMVSDFQSHFGHYTINLPSGKILKMQQKQLVSSRMYPCHRRTWGQLGLLGLGGQVPGLRPCLPNNIATVGSRDISFWFLLPYSSQRTDQGHSQLCKLLIIHELVSVSRTANDAVLCCFQSSKIRTVIKTPGIKWTQEHGMQQQRWAHFSVDRRHHLLSILSRLSPSPDWCVGVSALDLCLDNCTWLTDIVVRLFAWDAGVHSSNSRTSANKQQPIHRLPDNAESDPGLLFWPAEPVALLRLHRFDPKPDDDAASCSRVGAKDTVVMKVDDASVEMDHPHHDPCVMGSWGQWSECSATCGTGSRTRTRAVVTMTDSCPNLLQTTSEPCKTTNCVPRCELFGWSEWSSCTDGFVLCSPHDARVRSCSRRRNRFFRKRGVEAFCNQTLKEEEKCQPSDAGIIAAFNTDVLSRCYSPADSGPCKGNFLRWYYDDNVSGCRTFLYSGCRGSANRYSTEEECMQACRQYRRHMGQGNGTESDVSTLSASTVARSKATEASHSDVEDSPASVVDCAMSSWSAWSDCSVTCGRHGVRTRLRTVVRPATAGGKKCPRRKLRRKRCSRPACSDTDHCRYTEWSTWSACARSCGADTVQERIQRVQGISSHRRQCSVKLQRRLCSLPSCVTS